MTRKTLFASILMSTLFFSCGDKQEEQYPITYSSSTSSVYSTKVYTSNGEITDSTFIKPLMTSLQKTFDSLRTNEDIKKITITYHQADSATIFIEQKEVQTKQVEVTEINDVIYYETPDTVINKIALTDSDHFRYVPFYLEKKQIPTAHGYSTIEMYKPCYYATKSGTDLIMIFSDIYYITGFNNYYNIGINNSVKSDIKWDLHNDEMIIIQEHQIPLKHTITLKD